MWIIRVVLIALLATVACGAPATASPAGLPPLYSNVPELLPSLGEHRPVRADVWSPHMIAAGVSRVRPDAKLLVLDHEEFAPEESEQYAKVIAAVRQVADVPVGIYGYGSRAYRFHAYFEQARWWVDRPGVGPNGDAWQRSDLDKKTRQLDEAAVTLEQQRPATAAAEVLCPTLYVHYDQPPEVAYKAALGQIEDAKAEAQAAEAWAKANVQYYRWRGGPGGRAVVAFVNPCFAGQNRKGLLSPEQQDAVLRACVDANVSPLIWGDFWDRPENAPSLAAARRMTLRYYELLDAKSAAAKSAAN